jgi:hypothetical protein
MKIACFSAVVVLGLCANVYGGCPGGICHLKSKSNTVVESYVVNPPSTTVVKAPATTSTKTYTKTRSYRVSKWR